MSECVLDSGRFSNHTSTKVVHEVHKVKNKRLKMYITILNFINNGGSITDTSLIEFEIYLNDNDLNHLKSLYEYLILHKDILPFLRAYQRQYKESVDTAINLVLLFPSVDKPYLRDSISGFGIHKEDAEIIVDAYYWSSGKIDPKYITLERRALVNNKDRVLHILRNQCTEFPQTTLNLIHISEIPD